MSYPCSSHRLRQLPISARRAPCLLLHAALLSPNINASTGPDLVSSWPAYCDIALQLTTRISRFARQGWSTTRPPQALYSISHSIVSIALCYNLVPSFGMRLYTY
ncbi:hypothetical protein K505DRAFT_98181 [Melanomma pulvis-pyrius CBS 109.77]|uniref:Uncharacterized protein n=1 Tax=Melanomma pulvis-pyrius CBS 109.77 TaxID=1314802 RepID=A0A6A6WYH7_9PLEO|nr:hypothetical protein K505DRAFT_98181 [Melanomma pulvis-pyrius CBS 109.77]